MTGNAALTLNWTPPGGAKIAMPLTSLRPRYSLETRTTVDDSNTATPAPVTHTSVRHRSRRPGARNGHANGARPGRGETDDHDVRNGWVPASPARTMPGGNTYTYEYYLNGAGRPSLKCAVHRGQ